MGQIINSESIGKERKYLTRAIAVAIRVLAKQKDAEEDTRDLVVFIIYSLERLAALIEMTVAPWEKRDYWVKADRFRMEWDWTNVYAKKLRNFLNGDRWDEIALTIAEISAKFSNLKISENNRIGTPWSGCWHIFKNERN